MNNNENMNAENDLLNRSFIILDGLTDSYSKYTTIRELFEVYKRLTLDKEQRIEDKITWENDFKSYSALDKKNFVEIHYHYKFLEPTEQNIDLWETYHRRKWLG